MILCADILGGGAPLSLPSEPMYHLLCLAPAPQPAEEPAGPFPSCPLLPGQVSVGEGGHSWALGLPTPSLAPPSPYMGWFGGAAEASRFLAEENVCPGGEHCSLLWALPCLLASSFSPLVSIASALRCPSPTCRPSWPSRARPPAGPS